MNTSGVAEDAEGVTELVPAEAMCEGVEDFGFARRGINMLALDLGAMFLLVVVEN